MSISDITAKNTINALIYKAVSADDVTAETTELKKDTFDADSFFIVSYENPFVLLLPNIIPVRIRAADCEINNNTPILTSFQRIPPTVPITKAGLAPLQKVSSVSACAFVHFPLLQSSAAVFAPIGKPEIKPNIMAVEHSAETPKTGCIILPKILAHMSENPEYTARDEKTRKGKSDGMIVLMQKSRAFAPAKTALSGAESKAKIPAIGKSKTKYFFIDHR